MPVKSTPIACPLNTGGGLEGADYPKAWAGPKDKSKISGAVAILKLIMPMFNITKYGFNPQTWKFMGRYMVKQIDG